MDESVKWQPTFVGSEGVGRRDTTIRFEAEMPPMKVGDTGTLISSDGVTALEVAEISDDGVIRLVVRS